MQAYHNQPKPASEFINLASPLIASHIEAAIDSSGGCATILMPNFVGIFPDVFFQLLKSGRYVAEWDRTTLTIEHTPERIYVARTGGAQ